MKFLLKIIIYALAIFLCAYFLPGIHVQTTLDFLLLAVVLIVLKTVLKPVLVLLTLPINLMTLGLFTLVINTIIMLIADALLPGVTIDNIFWAFIFSLVLSVLTTVFESFEKKK